MRAQLFFVFAVVFLCTSMQAQDNNPGPKTVEEVLDLPGWFNEEFLPYVPQAEYHNAIAAHMADIEIVCIFGSWCSDSKREVPRMIRILQSKNIASDKLKLIAVDRSKRDPGGESLRYGIEKVPTFIFLRNGKEIGRIVESPLASLEKDMLGIIDPNAGTAAPPPPPPPHMPPPPVTIEEADGTVRPIEGEHHPEHPAADQQPPK